MILYRFFIPFVNFIFVNSDNVICEDKSSDVVSELIFIKMRPDL